MATKRKSVEELQKINDRLLDELGEARRQVEVLRSAMSLVSEDTLDKTDEWVECTCGEVKDGEIILSPEDITTMRNALSSTGF